MSSPPLRWSIDVNSVRTPLSLSYEANKDECLALARYAELEDVLSFSSEMRVSPLSGGCFKVTGALCAKAIQASVVNLTPVPTAIDESFRVEFWPEEMIKDRREEGTSFDDDSPEAIVNGQISIGEVLSEIFSVSLDPYPRNPGDEFSWEAGEAEKQPVTPFAELVKLRQKKADGG